MRGGVRRAGLWAGGRQSSGERGASRCDVNAGSDYGGRADLHSHKRVVVIVVRVQVVNSSPDKSRCITKATKMIKDKCC